MTRTCKRRFNSHKNSIPGHCFSQEHLREVMLIPMFLYLSCLSSNQAAIQMTRLTRQRPSGKQASDQKRTTTFVDHNIHNVHSNNTERKLGFLTLLTLQLAQAHLPLRQAKFHYQ